ncbi:sulfite oxidase [Halobacteriales archaeon QH_2_65_14]|nr:MAG: sulfite oxidase [Halobacteriales archaeon QH_2_65_14]
MPGRQPEVGRWLAKLQPPPRLVDWSLFAAVTFEAASGLLSFLGTTPAWVPLFWAHRIVGLTIILLLGFKLARVRRRLTDARQWRPTTLLSVLTLVVAAGAITTGVTWVFGFEPDVPYVSFLSIHVGFGLLLVPLVLFHLRTRFRPPRRTDFDRRRTTMQYSVMLVAGAVAYRGQELLNRTLDTHGTNRRLTGSQRRSGEGNDAFPAMSWVADDPDPVDTGEWSLTVRGAVSDQLNLDYDEFAPETEEEALLDCTGGWYTVQEWGGVRVGEVLDAAGATEDAAYVRFVSVTGYRWSLPIEEAREALLATHVGGERLSHGHGAPLRLVVPGRRGFQWVKWVERIDVRHRGDPAQWIVTLVSGFD